MRSTKIDTVRRRLLLPPLLTTMLETECWTHPGDDALRRVAPFIREPLTALSTFDMMLAGSGPLMAPHESENARFSEYRGSRIAPRELPWVDVEKTLFIFCNKFPGDDVGIALDYRPPTGTPRVVGAHWTDDACLRYQAIAESFDEFIRMIGLG